MTPQQPNMQNISPAEFDAVILANGDFPTAETPLRLLREAPFLCCCDGAAEAALARGFQPDAIVGDGDSLSSTLKSRYASIIHTESEQDDNDLTKATRFCKAKGFRRIAYLGATASAKTTPLATSSYSPITSDNSESYPKSTLTTGGFQLSKERLNSPPSPGNK